MAEFTRKCPKCRQAGVTAVTERYAAELDHDGRTYSVTVPDLVVSVCGNCGNRVFDDAANERLTDALRAAAGLLGPEQIRASREALNLTQRQLAALLGIAEGTISRWENGVQIQQRFHDRMLRAFFALPELRDYLARPGSSVDGGVSAAIPLAKA